MACKYLDKSPDRKQACLLQARVCRDWLIWHEDIDPEDRELFCVEALDDFEPDII